MRLVLVQNNERSKKGQKKANFVIEDMDKSTAKAFSRLHLEKYIPAELIFAIPYKNHSAAVYFSGSYKLRSDFL